MVQAQNNQFFGAKAQAVAQSRKDCCSAIDIAFVSHVSLEHWQEQPVCCDRHDVYVLVIVYQLQLDEVANLALGPFSDTIPVHVWIQGARCVVEPSDGISQGASVPRLDDFRIWEAALA